MFLAKVIGNVVATQKSPEFNGMKLLLIQPYINKDKVLVASGSSIVAVDSQFKYGPKIVAEQKIGSINVKGSIVGTKSTRVTIAVGGEVNVAFGENELVLGNLNVGGRVEYTNVLAGWDDISDPSNADAQIGTVHVGGDWVASNLTAGAKPGANGWGTPTKITGGIDDAKTISKIGSVTIDGQIIGDPAGPEDFGFIAEEVGAFTVDGLSIPLKAGNGNDLIAVGSTFDTTIDEIP